MTTCCGMTLCISGPATWPGAEYAVWASGVTIAFMGGDDETATERACPNVEWLPCEDGADAEEADWGTMPCWPFLLRVAMGTLKVNA